MILTEEDYLQQKLETELEVMDNKKESRLEELEALIENEENPITLNRLWQEVRDIQ